MSEVRDQSPFGTCWAFATIAAMESSLLAKGQVSLSDLSERHQAYFTHHSQPDALGNTTGDYTLLAGSSYGPAMSDPYLNAGGNAVVASHVVETGQGVVPEHVAPYDELVASYFENEDSDKFLDSTALDSALAYQSAATIRNAYFIAMTDCSDVKRAVMEYGAAVIEVLMPDEPYFNYIVVSGKGNYAGSVSKTFTIAKAANPLKVSARAPVVKYSKKKVSVKASEAYAFSKKPKGSVKYSRVVAGSSKALSVNAKTGAITVKKATKRGTYKIRVKIAASGTANYKSAAKTITVKLRVK